MEKRANRQGGWLASFVIVGTLLVLALLGTAYFIKRQQAEPNEPSPVPATNEPTQPSESTDTNKTPVAEDNKQEQPERVDTNESTKPTPTDTEKTDEGGSESSPATGRPLPTTGPEDTAFQAFVLLLVSFTVASYLRSRRPHFDIS